jgi:hypothetical protein
MSSNSITILNTTLNPNSNNDLQELYDNISYNLINQRIIFNTLKKNIYNTLEKIKTNKSAVNANKTAANMQRITTFI